jgi:hypothetical protein
MYGPKADAAGESGCRPESPHFRRHRRNGLRGIVPRGQPCGHLYAERKQSEPGSVIKSCGDKVTGSLISERGVRVLPAALHRRAYVRLQALDAGDKLDFVRLTPAHRLEHPHADQYRA